MSDRADLNIEDLVANIAKLPAAWHGSGSIGERVLEAIASHVASGPSGLSVETGTGRSTLLFSHLSAHHLVFTKDDTGNGDSLAAVRTSDLLNKATVTFEIGPTQKTLLHYRFDEPIVAAFLDGPHAYPFPELEYWAVYPYIPAGGLLIVDDIQIPTIANMVSFLRADAMWKLVEIADTTAFFRRTDADAVDPFGEGWWLQGFNARPAGRHLAPLRRIRSFLRLR